MIVEILLAAMVGCVFVIAVAVMKLYLETEEQVNQLKKILEDIYKEMISR